MVDFLILVHENEFSFRSNDDKFSFWIFFYQYTVFEQLVNFRINMIKKLTELLSLDVGLYHGEWNFTENYIHNEILLKISPLYKERI